MYSTSLSLCLPLPHSTLLLTPSPSPSLFKQSAFPADTTGLSNSSEQHTCPATPSFRRIRGRLLSLSESGEFVDEEGHPHSADTVSTTSSETGLSDEREDRMGSSVDLLQNPLEVRATDTTDVMLLLIMMS